MPSTRTSFRTGLCLRFLSGPSAVAALFLNRSLKSCRSEVRGHCSQQTSGDPWRPSAVLPHTSLISQQSSVGNTKKRVTSDLSAHPDLLDHL